VAHLERGRYELEPFDETAGVGLIVRKIAGNVVYFKNTGAGVPGYPGGANFVADPPAAVANYVQTEVHTYAVEWTATKITWFLDGTAIHMYTGTAPTIPNLSAKIMMNLWVFGGRISAIRRQHLPAAKRVRVVPLLQTHHRRDLPLLADARLPAGCRHRVLQEQPNEATYP